MISVEKKVIEFNQIKHNAVFNGQLFKVVRFILFYYVQQSHLMSALVMFWPQFQKRNLLNHQNNQNTEQITSFHLKNISLNAKFELTHDLTWMAMIKKDLNLFVRIILHYFNFFLHFCVFKSSKKTSKFGLFLQLNTNSPSGLGICVIYISL
jgi:hypothetical protein